jgi:hypothetical protein
VDNHGFGYRNKIEKTTPWTMIPRKGKKGKLKKNKSVVYSLVH